MFHRFYFPLLLQFVSRLSLWYILQSWHSLFFQIVAIAFGICAEFGADFLKPHTKGSFVRYTMLKVSIFSTSSIWLSCLMVFPGILGHLKTAMENPNATHPDNIMAYEAAVSTCGKLNQFVSEGISYEVLSYYYSFLYHSKRKLHTLEHIYNFSWL